MIVLDASVAIALLTEAKGADSTRVAAVFEDDVAAPHLIDLEVLYSLRRRHRAGLLTLHQSRRALEDLDGWALRRYPHTVLMGRILELRDNLSAYDAAYVALAELLEAPLVTRDARLAGAPGNRAEVRLVGTT